MPVARFSIVRERLGASRLPSLRSALCGLDPPGTLPPQAFTVATGQLLIPGLHLAAVERRNTA
jgi:hypothetical protein